MSKFLKKKLRTNSEKILVEIQSEIEEKCHEILFGDM